MDWFEQEQLAEKDDLRKRIEPVVRECCDMWFNETPDHIAHVLCRIVREIVRTERDIDLEDTALAQAIVREIIFRKYNYQN